MFRPNNLIRLNRLTSHFINPASNNNNSPMSTNSTQASTTNPNSTTPPRWLSKEDPNQYLYSNPWPYTSIAPPSGHILVPPHTEVNLEKIPKLFHPLNIRGLTLKNRIGVSPMCQYTSTNGFLTDWHLVNLGQFAVGGAALVIQEATAVVPEGRITPNDAGIYLPEHVTMLKRIVAFIHSQSAAAGIQLAHAGRKASTPVPWSEHQHPHTVDEKDGGWPHNLVGASAIPFDSDWVTPKAMTIQEIKDSIQHWITATKRAEEVGYDVVEVHAAHGYLLSSFLSPLSNQRTDEYGGSFENRIRYLLEIVTAVRNVWPQHKPLFVRLSCSEWVEGGWNSDDTVKLVGKLKDLGVDLVDCSSGGNNPKQQIKVGKGYQVPFSEAIKKQYDGKILTGTVGIIVDAQQAEDILEKGQADFVFLARELLRNPRFPIEAAKQLGVKLSYTPQMQRAARWANETLVPVNPNDPALSKTKQ